MAVKKSIMMDKNRFVLGLFISFFLLSVSAFAQYGCCVDSVEGICSSGIAESSCEGNFYEDTLCDDVADTFNGVFISKPCEQVCNICTDGEDTFSEWEQRIFACFDLEKIEERPLSEANCRNFIPVITEVSQLPYIEGYVFETTASGEVGVSNARVVCGSKVVYSGTDGKFETYCDSQVNTISATKDVLSGETRIIANTDATGVKIELLGATETNLKITVMAGSVVVPGVTINVTGKDYSKLKTTKTNGIAEFDDAPRNKIVVIKANKTGYPEPQALSENLNDAIESFTIYLEAGSTMTVSGFILDESSQEPIEDVLVQLFVPGAATAYASARSKSDGSYSITAGQRNYNFKATHPDYEDESGVIVSPYDKFNILMDLAGAFTATTANFNLLAVDSITKGAIADVEVIFKNINNQVVQIKRTSSDGRINNLPLSIGYYTLTLLHENYNKLIVPFNLNKNMDDPLVAEMTFIPNITITGKVTDLDGKSIPNTIITTDEAKTYYAASSGDFRLQKRISSYVGIITASAPGYASKDVQIAAGWDEDISNLQIKLAEQRCSSILDLGELNFWLDDFDKTEVKFKWSSPCSAEPFRVYRRTGQETRLMDVLSGSTFYYEDDSLEPEKTYYYWIEADYDFGISGKRTLVSEEIEIVVGSKMCFDGDKEFCQAGLKKECVNGMLIEGSPQCLEGEVCMEKIWGTTCVPQRTCDLCNRPFDVFSYDSGSVLFGRKGFLETIFSYSSASETDFKCSDSNVPCFLDASNTVANKNYDCSEIISCYDYSSETACEVENKCLKSQTCEWIESDYGELGVGVCRPTKLADQTCEAFNEGRMVENKVFAYKSGIAASSSCKLYKSDESCMYSEFREECLDKKDISCIDYGKSYDLCLGENNPQAFDLNVAWLYLEGDSMKIGGDNSLITKSNDLHSLGICQFLEETPEGFSGCMRNADDSPSQMNEEGFDCQDLTDSECLADNIPPETFVFSKEKVSEINFDYDIKDEYSEDLVNTYYSIFTQEDEDAGLSALYYPTEETREGKIRQITPDDYDGKFFWIYYFSQDYAKNLEEIRKFSVKIDRTRPEVNLKFITKPNLDTKDVSLTVLFELPLPLKSDGNQNDQTVQCINDSTTGLWKKTDSEYSSLNDKLYSSTIGNLADKSFSETYSSIETQSSTGSGVEVQYRWKCYDEAGNPAESSIRGVSCDDEMCHYDFILDADSTFTEPMPNVAVKERTDVAVSIKTQNKGSCKFSDKKSTTFDTWTSFSTTGDNAPLTATGYLHSGTYTVKEEYENQQLYVGCIFDGLEEPIYGIEEDQISITIDRLKPHTLIKDVKTEEIKDVVLSNNVWIGGSDGNHVKLVCEDEDQNYIPGESGCKAIYYCSVPKDSNEQCNFRERGTIYTPDVQESLNVKYYSVDNLENQETEKSVVFKLDKQKPEISLSAPFDVNFDTQSKEPLLTFKIENKFKELCTTGCEVSPIDTEGMHYQIRVGQNVARDVAILIDEDETKDEEILRSKIPVLLEENKKNTFELFVKDEAGNEASQTISITHDSVGPNLLLSTISQVGKQSMNVDYGKDLNIAIGNVKDLEPGETYTSSRVNAVWVEDMFGGKYELMKEGEQWKGTITTSRWPVTTSEFPTYFVVYAKDKLGNENQTTVYFNVTDNKPPKATVFIENKYGAKKSKLIKGENFVVLSADEGLRNITLYFEASNEKGTSQFPVVFIAKDYDSLTWVGFVDIPENYSQTFLMKGSMYDLNGVYSENFLPGNINANSMPSTSASPENSKYENDIYYISTTSSGIDYVGMSSEKTYQITVNGRIYDPNKETPLFDPGINSVVIRTEDSEGNYEESMQKVDVSDLISEAKTDTTAPETRDYDITSNFINISDKIIVNTSTFSITGSKGTADYVYVIGADKRKYDSVSAEGYYDLAEIRLLGNTFTETENVLRLVFEDAAGNKAEKQIVVVKDIRPPHLKSLNFTRRY